MKKLLILISILIVAPSLAMDPAQPKPIKSLIDLALSKAAPIVDINDPNFKYIELPVKRLIIAQKMQELKKWDFDKIMDFMENNPSLEELINLIPDALLRTLMQEPTNFATFLYQLQGIQTKNPGLYQELKNAFSEQAQPHGYHMLFLACSKEQCQTYNLPVNLILQGDTYQNAFTTISQDFKSQVLLFILQKVQSRLIENFINNVRSKRGSFIDKPILTQNLYLLESLKKYATHDLKKYIEQVEEIVNALTKADIGNYNIQKIQFDPQHPYIFTLSGPITF